MTEKCFVDTNVFVYTRSQDQEEKREKVEELIRKLWNSSALIISTQVVTEFCAVLSKKFATDHELITLEAKRLLLFHPIPVNQGVIEQGLVLKRQYHLSWWDAWIIAAAIVSGCSTLYSEDLAHEAVYQSVQVKNPFL